MKINLFRKFSRPKYIQAIYSAIALTSVALFALWWFDPLHVPDNFTGPAKIIDIILFILVSYVIWHPIIMDVLTWAVSSHIKDIRNQKPVPGLKVAFITTIVPANESLDLLHKCLPAMRRATYKHDTWLLDEDNHPEVKKICQQYGVWHFSRNGKSQFNTRTGKYTRTKGGNHNSWYDTYGNYYDIVAQIDTDFVPKKTFLTKTLGYFRDPDVAFVGTPQIYGNTKNSLIAKGADQQQYTFYGSILRGLSGMGMNLLIGANHVIRVAALKGIGHYKAHITEDLPTGMKLHASGWKSVYLPYPLATGEGPFTWEAYFNQQMRWAYGCIDIFFHYTPKLFKKLGFRRAIYYFFLEQHYFSGIAMAASTFLLGLYFTFGLRAADIDLVKFFIFYSSELLICWLMSVWLQRFNVFPKKEGELLLAGKIISIAAWPVWFLAFLSVLTGKRLDYKVTPKGIKGRTGAPSPVLFIPHFFFGAIAILGLLSSFITHRQNPAMLFWASSSAFLMLTVPFSRVIAQYSSRTRIGTVNLLRKIYRFEIKHTPEYLKHGTHLSVFPLYNTSPVREIISDCIFLCGIVFASLFLYIRKIGFYSDDWSFLGNFTLSADKSLLGLFRIATTPNTSMRPLQNLYDAVLFMFFGTQPLGYQLVNALVLLSITLLFYFVLRQLRIPRIIALTVPLVYSLLPNYSTDRFWFAAFQANLSMLFFFISFYAGLRALSLATVRTTIWKILSIFSLLLSALSYEVALPLAFLNMIIFWNPLGKFRKSRNASQKPVIFIVLTFITLIYIFVFKALTTTRLGKVNYPGDVTHIIDSVFRTNYGALGLNLPYIWGAILSLYSNPAVIMAAFILYVIIFIYLHSVISRPQSYFPSNLWMRSLTFFSFIIFLLGYAIFFTNNKVGFSPTGVDNRVAIAAAIGIAFTIVGGIGWVCRFIPSDKLSKWSFCTLISIMCTGGFLIINTLASFWVDAYQQGQVILSDIRQQFPVIPKGSTLILDNVCPYVGPGIVFESQWDLKGALQTIYRDPEIHADIVTPRLKITGQGINTQIYTFPARYSYKNLFIYNFKTKTTHPITNAASARSYFQKYNPDRNNGCPAASAGNGVSIF